MEKVKKQKILCKINAGFLREENHRYKRFQYFEKMVKAVENKGENSC